MRDLTLIIPAKNEAESLPYVLDELQKFNYKINIILHRTDTKTIHAIKNYDVALVYQKNFGYGDAIIEGINQCKTKYFCIFNADGSFIPDEIEKMHNKIIKNDADFIFASRYEIGSKSDDDTIITSLGNFLFTKIGNFFFNLLITDILYTFVLGKAESAKKLKLKQSDFRLCVELPIKARRNKMKLLNNIAHERSRIAGKKKVNAAKDGFLILLAMIKYFFKI